MGTHPILNGVPYYITAAGPQPCTVYNFGNFGLIKSYLFQGILNKKDQFQVSTMRFLTNLDDMIPILNCNVANEKSSYGRNLLFVR